MFLGVDFRLFFDGDMVSMSMALFTIWTVLVILATKHWAKIDKFIGDIFENWVDYTESDE